MHGLISELWVQVYPGYDIETMIAKPLKPSEFCPFWSAESLKCKVCNDGLFIPFDDHIKVYCTTLDYPQCLQYALYAGSHLQASEERDLENRRKYQRVETEHRVTLVKLTKSGEMVSHYSTVAKTLDVSMGGMRVLTSDPLLNDTVVQFSFDDSFPKSLQSGMGQIKWCNKQVDEKSYQIGLSFQEENAVKAMGSYLMISS